MKWLENKRCQNYFIPRCNLFGHKINDIRVKEILRILTEMMNEATLGRWFMQNFISRALNNAGVLSAENEHA